MSAGSNDTAPLSAPSDVDDLLADMLTVRRYLAAVPGPPSNAGIALDAARSGVIGDGCSVHVPRGYERTLRTVRRPLEYVRLFASELASLPHHGLRVWLVASTEVRDLEARTVAPLVLSYDPKSQRDKLRHSLDLRERIAWVYADDQKRAQWERGLRSGDSRAARIALLTAGQDRLIECAEEWCRSA